MYTIPRDSQPNAVRVRSAGFWTLEEAAAYSRDLAAALEECRREAGYVLVHLDAREALPQSAAVLARLAEVESILVRTPHDRIAIVAPNGLLKYQFQRLSRSRQISIFLSPSAAETWLYAHEGASRSAYQ